APRPRRVLLDRRERPPKLLGAGAQPRNHFLAARREARLLLGRERFADLLFAPVQGWSFAERGFVGRRIVAARPPLRPGRCPQDPARRPPDEEQRLLGDEEAIAKLQPRRRPEPLAR